MWEPVTAQGASGLATTDARPFLAPERDSSNLVVGRNLVELAQEFAPRCEEDSTAGCIEEDDSDEGDTSLTPQSQATGGGPLCCRSANVAARPERDCQRGLTCPTPGTPLITDIRCETQRCPPTKLMRFYCLLSNGSQAGPIFMHSGNSRAPAVTPARRVAIRWSRKLFNIKFKRRFRRLR